MSTLTPNPYSPPSSSVAREPEREPEPTSPRSGPAGLGGWLVMVGIGLIVAPIRVLIFVVQTYPPLIRDGSFRAIATPGSASFNAPLAALIALEAFANIFCFAFGIWLIVLFFRKSRRFPMRYVVLSALSIAIIVADSISIGALGIDSPWDTQGRREFVRSVTNLLVWGPYMFMSKRVENTFVRT